MITIVLVSIVIAFAVAMGVAIRVTNAGKKAAAAAEAAAGGQPGERERLAGPHIHNPYAFTYQKDARRLLGNAVPSDYAASNALSGMMHMPLRPLPPRTPLLPPPPPLPPGAYALLV